MESPVITLRNLLYDLPGGYKDTMRGYRTDLERDDECRTDMEHYADSMMFLERLLMNRNALLMSFPEGLFSKRLKKDQELQFVFRCAMAELGGEGARGYRAIENLEEVVAASKQGNKDAKAILKRANESYRNNPLRLKDKDAAKLREEFEAGWPPLEYDDETLERMEFIHSTYEDVFNEIEYASFVHKVKRENAIIKEGLDAGIIKRGPDSFKYSLKSEKIGSSILYAFDLWTSEEKNVDTGLTSVETLVTALVDSFREVGYHESAIDSFRRTTLGAYKVTKDITDRDLPEGFGGFKATVIYNLIVCAFYGPANAVNNCFYVDTRGTSTSDELARTPVKLPLERGGGEAIIRHDRPDGSVRIIGGILNLDTLPESEGKLICVIGRNMGSEGKSLPDVDDSAVRLARETANQVSGETFYALGGYEGGKTVSRRHVGVYALNGEIVIVDLNSTNGTRVERADGAVVNLGYDAEQGQVPSTVAMRGDRLLVGCFILEVL